MFPFPRPVQIPLLLGLTAFVLVLAYAPPIAASEPTPGHPEVRGQLSGTVRDADERTPLHGATVTILQTDMKTGTDADGRFDFDPVDSGRYTLVATYVGYASDTLMEVSVLPGRKTEVALFLHSLPIEGPPIVVTGAVDPLPLTDGGGTVELSTEQIRSRPGAMGDINRVVAGMPTTARFDDRYASLVVRGGSPMENGYYIDNMPVPSISHFPSQGNAGGPLGLLNSTIIDDATFYTGGFSVAYGDRMSSVLDITLRDGNRESFSGQAELAVSGASVTAEAPLIGGRGSWLVCARHSFLSLLRDAVDLGATPNYDDLYTKISRDLGNNSSLSVIGLLGRGDFYIDRDVSYQAGVDFYGQMDYSSGTIGLAWNRTWTNRGSVNLSLSFSHMRWSNDNDFTANNTPLYDNDSRENSVTLRTVNTRRFGERLRSHFGGEIHYLAADYDYAFAKYSNGSGYLNPAVTVTATPDYYSGGLWLEQEWRPSHRFSATVGLRGDIVGYAAHKYLSPRGSVRLRPTENLSLYAAAGLYYQSLPLVIILQHEDNKGMQDPRALHLVGGVGMKLTRALRINIEGYVKRYDHMPMDSAQPPVFILDELVYNYGFIAGHYPLLDNGRSRVYGCEITLRLRPSDRFFLRTGLGLSRARYRAVDNIWRARVIDNRVASDIEISWRPGSRWGFSARWIYGGGRPYTPYDEPASKSFGDGILDVERANTVRFAAYHSMTIRFERRFAIRGSDLTVYAELWNAYNRRNVAGQYWDEESRMVEEVHQFPRLPIMGLEYRF